MVEWRHFCLVGIVELALAASRSWLYPAGGACVRHSLDGATRQLLVASFVGVCLLVSLVVVRAVAVRRRPWGPSGPTMARWEIDPASSRQLSRLMLVVVALISVGLETLSLLLRRESNELV